MTRNSTPRTLFHFLISLKQEKELFSEDLVSFFNELDTRQGTLLQGPCFIF